MNYLSINNSPEANLHIIAQSDNWITQNLDKLLQNKKMLVLKGLISIATTVATVALGVILGFVVAPYLGIVAAIAIIPLAAWLYFKNKEKGNQNILNTELKSLNTIYAKMIDCVKLRNDYRKNYFSIKNSDIQNQLYDYISNIRIEKDWGLMSEIKNKISIHFEGEGKEYLSKLEADLFQPTSLQKFLEGLNEHSDAIETMSEEDKLQMSAEDQKLILTLQILKEIIIKLEAMKGKVEVNISEFKKDAQKVSQKVYNAKLKNVVKEKTLVDLKEACQEFALPISTYLTYEKAAENRN